MSKIKTYASVWDALADTPEQAANLRARAELMQQIAAIVKKTISNDLQQSAIPARYRASVRSRH